MKNVISALRASPPWVNAAGVALPRIGDLRWTAAKKLAVIIALRRGVITAADVRDRYMISLEELGAWEAALDHRGIAGLYAKTLIRRGGPGYSDLAPAGPPTRRLKSLVC
jgi:hypothetical protein